MKKLIFVLFLWGCDGSQSFVLNCGRGCQEGGGRMLRATYGMPPNVGSPTSQGGPHLCECVLVVEPEKKP